MGFLHWPLSWKKRRLFGLAAVGDEFCSLWYSAFLYQFHRAVVNALNANPSIHFELGETILSYKVFYFTSVQFCLPF